MMNLTRTTTNEYARTKYESSTTTNEYARTSMNQVQQPMINAQGQGQMMNSKVQQPMMMIITKSSVTTDMYQGAKRSLGK